VPIAWQRGSIWQALEGLPQHAAWRLTVNEGGAIRWLWLAEPLSMTLRTGVPELGRQLRRVRLPGLTSAGGVGARVQHEALRQSAVDELLDMLGHAAQFDRSMVGVLLHEASGEAGIVRMVDETLDVRDLQGFQPENDGERWLGVDLNLESA
jgi:hypothetical protein